MWSAGHLKSRKVSWIQETKLNQRIQTVQQRTAALQQQQQRTLLEADPNLISAEEREAIRQQALDGIQQEADQVCYPVCFEGVWSTASASYILGCWRIELQRGISALHKLSSAKDNLQYITLVHT